MAQDPDQTLRSDVEAACMLLSYAAQAGLDIKSDTSKTIAKSKQLLKSATLVGDDETAFYLAYRDVAKLASPVTMASLGAANAVAPQTWYRKLLRLEPITEAKHTVNWYWNLTFYWLFVLLVVQVYWVIGSTAVTAIKESYDAEAKVTLELATVKEKLRNEKKPQSNPETDKLDTDKTNLQNRRATYHRILEGWNWGWQLKWKGVSEILFESKSTTKDGSKFQFEATDSGTVLALANFALLALQGYVLPLLYGLLGACTYVLRALLNEIQALTYTSKSFISYKVRIVLGTLSGLAVTWFFQPSAEIFKSLSPLTLAFVAGYSVEILFAAMDKFVSAFSAKDLGQDKPKTP